MRRRDLLALGAGAGLLPFRARAQMRAFGRGGWQALLAAHAGRPAVVHFWGLTCGPCMAELPVWGRFARANPAAPLIIVAADPMPTPADQIAAVLARSGLGRTESWRFESGFAERLYFEVDPEWQGELPRTCLLTAAGVQQDAWLGETDFDRLGAWIAANGGGSG